jgi:succinate dehydrogenase / fumarate reductase, cytochrome b subunit
MQKKQYFDFYTSSIGRKFIMANTGILLLVFLIIHLGLNLTIFAADDGILFNRIADSIQNLWAVHILEILILIGFAIHTWQGISLALSNSSKQNIAYEVRPISPITPARSMSILGSIILVFLLLHLFQFWLPNIINTSSQSKNLYQLVQETMSQWWVVVSYIIGCTAVAAHLLHGSRSIPITLGIPDQYVPFLSIVGSCIAIVIPLGLAIIPFAFFINAHAQP